jgi:hypothetical protein
VDVVVSRLGMRGWAEGPGLSSYRRRRDYMWVIGRRRLREGRHLYVWDVLSILTPMLRLIARFLQESGLVRSPQSDECISNPKS